MRTDWKEALAALGRELSLNQTGRVLKHGLALINASGRAPVHPLLVLVNVRERLRPEQGLNEPKCDVKPIIDLLLSLRETLGSLAEEKEDRLAEGWRYVRSVCLLLFARLASEDPGAAADETAAALLSAADIPFIRDLLQSAERSLGRLAEKDKRFESFHGGIIRLLADFSEHPGSHAAVESAKAAAQDIAALRSSLAPASRRRADELLFQLQAAAVLAAGFGAASSPAEEQR